MCSQPRDKERSGKTSKGVRRTIFQAALEKQQVHPHAAGARHRVPGGMAQHEQVNVVQPKMSQQPSTCLLNSTYQAQRCLHCAAICRGQRLLDCTFGTQGVAVRRTSAKAMGSAYSLCWALRRGEAAVPTVPTGLRAEATGEEDLLSRDTSAVRPHTGKRTSRAAVFAVCA